MLVDVAVPFWCKSNSASFRFNVVVDIIAVLVVLAVLEFLSPFCCCGHQYISGFCGLNPEEIGGRLESEGKTENKGLCSVD
ncbi:unnamed protein product [Gongylonema pulchrum]|uniref:Transmembrane protein n=1 Tax=Gongylonema pulchrum TaxID=637853 RepID=A0A183DTN5_9BILA|nr:unnamed protein product [Gongylonema pulchrum]